VSAAFEVLNANLVLNLGLSGDDRDHRLAAGYFINPVVFTKHPQPLSYRFIERIGRNSNLNDVRYAVQVAARHVQVRKAT
jgi:hypothetical protein